jgi:hypothetical protein
MLTYHTYIYISLWFVNYDLWHAKPTACVALQLLSDGRPQWLPNVHIIPTHLRLRLSPLHSQNIIILKLCWWSWLRLGSQPCIVFGRLYNRRILKLWWIRLTRGNWVGREIFLLRLHHLSWLTYYFCRPNYLFSFCLLCWTYLRDLFLSKTNKAWVVCSSRRFLRFQLGWYLIVLWRLCCNFVSGYVH